MSDEKDNSEEFKIPAPHLLTKPPTEKSSQGNKVPKSVKEENPSTKDKAKLNVPLPYTEPEWSDIPPLEYSLEVIKNGTSVSFININASYLVIGRLEVCNIVLEHPSVSRYHAIIQYCKGDETRAKGFYLYDLGSTHGTFLNKEKVQPNIFYKLKVGYVIKFGGSTRLHIFQGPEEQEEEESNKNIVNKIDEDSCTWGMQEDAVEDLSENPYALSTPNEELYLDDPKKTLRNWFEREGYDLEYKVEEKGFKTFLCRIELPVDNAMGDFLSVEASVSGKKKEAIVACALEACRTLDRFGLLRQSHQESRQRKKKNWEENDYYDSDEDTFLDRTGTIEKKREMRKKTEKTEVETYESLEAKLKVVNDEITDIKRKLELSLLNAKESSNEDVDSLEMYMSNLKEENKCPLDKIEKTKLKFKLSELSKERNRLEKLLEIVKPAKLPSITKYPGIVGKKLKSRLNPSLFKSKTVKIDANDENIEEVESGDENESEAKTMKSESQNNTLNENVDSLMKEKCFDKNIQKPIKTSLNINKEENDLHKLSELSSKNNEVPKKAFDINEDKTIDENDQSSKSDTTLGVKRSRDEENSQNDKSQKTQEPKIYKCENMPKKFKITKKTKNIDVYKTGNAEYSTWVPPADQSGDGITHLNAKYGY